MAISRGYHKIAQMLLDAGAVVKSKDGDTLLSAAMRSGNAHFVKPF